MTEKKIAASVAMLKVLEAWGVKDVYGYPGGSFNSTMKALDIEKENINYVQVRHEQVGALAAAAHAKLTGQIGVTFGSAGPGAVNLLNGLYDAKEDHAPVLALVGQVPHTNMNYDYFQEFPEVPMFQDVAVYDRIVMTPESASTFIWTKVPAIVIGAVVPAIGAVDVARGNPISHAVSINCV